MTFPPKKTKPPRKQPLWLRRFHALAVKEALLTITPDEMRELELLDKRRSQ